MSELNPADFIISRKRKKYRFALFHNSPLCFEVDEWEVSTQPEVLEIGAGTALFSVELAKASPTSPHVAVDVKADRLQAGARGALEHHLTNLQLLRARADQLPGLFSPHSLMQIWVTFPDPFPKERSAKRRLMHAQFLKIYASALYFKTDATALFTWSLEQLVKEGWTLKELSFDLHDSALPDLYKLPTTYEARYMGEGLKINFVKALPPKPGASRAPIDRSYRRP